MRLDGRSVEYEAETDIDHRNDGRQTAQVAERRATERGSYGAIDIEIDLKDDVEDKKKWGCLPYWVKGEFKEVFNLCWSNMIVSLTYNLLAPMSLIFMGQLGTKYLDAVGLGNTVMNVCGILVVSGLTTACDTVFSQSFGSTNKKMVGIYLQRSYVIILLFLFPCFMVHLNVESILRAMGQEPEIARITGDYCLYLMPGIVFAFIYSIEWKWIRNQNIIFPTVWIGCLGLGVSILLHYLLVSRAGLEILGSAIAQDSAYFTMALSTFVYILVSKTYRTTWGGFTTEAFQDWGPFMVLGLAGMAMVCLQWVAFEIGTLLTGLLGEIQLGAQAILFQVELFTFIMPISVGVACNMRVGQLLGANNPWLARRSLFLGYAMVWMLALVIIAILLGLKDFIPRIFSTDEEVIKTASEIIPILALYHIFDATASTSTGILRGCGRQNIAAVIIFVGMFVIGMPVGLPLMFLTDLKSAGYWWGLTIGLSVEGILFFVAVFKTDWKGEAAAAQLRAGVKPEEKAQTASVSDSSDEEDEKDRTALIKRSPSQQLAKKNYCGEYVSSQPNISKKFLEATEPLSKSVLIFRRLLTFILFFLIFVIGLICRFIFTNPIEKDLTTLCIPYNATWRPDVLNMTDVTFSNMSLPVCNTTRDTNSTYMYYMVFQPMAL